MQAQLIGKQGFHQGGRGSFPRRAFPFLALAMTLSTASPGFAYTAYVTNERDNTVSVVDLDKMQTVKTIEVGQRPRGIVISPDGKFLYICAGDDDIVQIVDTKTQEVVGDLPSGSTPTGICASALRSFTSMIVTSASFSFER